MSHIDNITRATKAYHILSQATNVHLDLFEQIERLGQTETYPPLFAAYKALTGETFSLGLSSHLMPTKLEKAFFHKLDITGSSYQDKVDQLNEFGNDIYLDDLAEYQHEVETFGLNHDSPSLQDNHGA